MGYFIAVLLLDLFLEGYTSPPTSQIEDRQIESVAVDSVGIVPPFVEVRKWAKSGPFRFTGVSYFKMDSLVQQVTNAYKKQSGSQPETIEMPAYENQSLLDTALSDFSRFKYHGYRLRLKFTTDNDKHYLLVRYWRCVQLDLGKKWVRRHRPYSSMHQWRYTMKDDVSTRLELHVFLLDQRTGMIVRYKRFAKAWSAISDPELGTVRRLFKKSNHIIPGLLPEVHT